MNVSAWKGSTKIKSHSCFNKNLSKCFVVMLAAVFVCVTFGKETLSSLLKLKNLPSTVHNGLT